MTEQTETTEPAMINGFVIQNVEDAEKIAEALERARPLDDSQRRNLLDILGEDAETAERKIRDAFLVERSRVAREARETIPEPVDTTDSFRHEAEALVKAYVKGLKRLNKRAAKAGTKITGPFQIQYLEKDYGVRLERINVGEYEQAVRKAEADATAPLDLALAKALSLIQDQRAQANRQIRLAAVSKDAAAILHTLPNADAIVASIQTAVEDAREEIEQAAKDGRPLNVLMSRVGGRLSKRGYDPDLGFESQHEKEIAAQYGVRWDYNPAEGRNGFYNERTGKWSFRGWRPLVSK